MRIKKFAVRGLVLAAGLAGCVGFAGLSGEGVAAADTRCSVSNGHQVERVEGRSGCGAKAGVGSRASADEYSGRGTAVSVSDNGGNAAAYNLQPGSTALAGANSRGNAYSVTTGPSALSVAQARRGGTTVGAARPTPVPKVPAAVAVSRPRSTPAPVRHVCTPVRSTCGTDADRH